MSKRSEGRAAGNTLPNGAWIVRAAHENDAIVPQQRDGAPRAKLRPLEEPPEIVDAQRANDDAGKAAVGVRQPSAKADRLATVRHARLERLAEIQPCSGRVAMHLEVIPVSEIDGTRRGRAGVEHELALLVRHQQGAHVRCGRGAVKQH